MARVAMRFYIFSLLLVGSTIYLPHPVSASLSGLIATALLALGMAVVLHFFPWDAFEPRVFTIVHVLSSASLVTLLVYFTGGVRSSYDLLFFLIILFSYFYNLREMLAITTVVSLFYLLPFLYDRPQPSHIAAGVVMVLFFYLGTYILYGVTRFVLKKNEALQELTRRLTELGSVTTALLKDLQGQAIMESLSERLKDHLPTTYCVVMLFDDKLNLIVRIACPVRTLSWEPMIGAVFTPDRLTRLRTAIEARQPKVYRLETDEIDDDLRSLITRNTHAILVVPVRIAAENVGAIIFGEERRWERSPITHESIQLGVAISRQVSTAVNLWWCFERLSSARHDLTVSHDKVIKAERLATLGEVTRAVEHEINNPLNVIMNWAEIYREDEQVEPEVRKKFQIIFDMAMRIRSVIIKLTEIKDVKAIEFLKDKKMTDLG
jgi:signal transduction histidine kinase